MSPEELKIIAEGMGYNAINRNGFIYYWVGAAEYNYKPSPPHIYEPPPSNATKYNPLTNDTQGSEIEEKLKLYTWWFETDKLWKSTTTATNDVGMICFGMGKTPKEARCNAALKFFKEAQNANEITN